jgi:rhamnulose-1-phosphate aldolase/alcohol dehydrogenase
MAKDPTAVGLTYLEDLWDDAEAAGMDEADLLRYRSNLLGRDLRLTNYGGGNTSAKIPMPDPLTGEDVTVLWVKGSGGDLGSIKRDGFATLYQDKLDALKNRYRGVEFEDEMVDLYPLCVFENNSRAPSIDTPLHAFLPFRHVDHLHPDWAIALAASANGPAHLERLREETGVHLVWLPWKRPGFELGLWLEKAHADNPGCDGILLGSHGLFTWGETARESYVNTLRVLDAIGRYVVPKVEAKGDAALFGGQKIAPREDRRAITARLLPVLRGEIAAEGGARMIGHFTDAPEVLRFVNSRRAAALAYQGTSCPDHFVRTKVRPLFVGEWDPAAGDVGSLIAAARAAFPAYRADTARYYADNKEANSPAVRSPNPTVVLVPGVGLFSFGKSKTEARITAEFYVNAIHVMEGATALADPSLPAQTDIAPERIVDNYVALTPREAFRIEYWLLEEAKLQRMPAEKELSRQVALVIGVSPGIGRAIAHKLGGNGAHVVCADLRPNLAEESTADLQKTYGKETAASLTVDCTDRASVRTLLEQATLQFGGVDILVVVAAVFFPPDENGRITEDQWRTTFDVNLLGSYVPADEARRLMQAQGLPSSIVLISSANAVVAKKGSLAYDTSKAALNHLVRELSVEGAPLVRVNGVAPASVVEGSLQFPRERVETSLEKYGLPHAPDESTETLRERLSDFYSKRTLLHKRVTPAQVAEAVFLLASERLPLTTGHILPVDAGLSEAALR